MSVYLIFIVGYNVFRSTAVKGVAGVQRYPSHERVMTHVSYFWVGILHPVKLTIPHGPHLVPTSSDLCQFCERVFIYLVETLAVNYLTVALLVEAFRATMDLTPLKLKNYSLNARLYR